MAAAGSLKAAFKRKLSFELAEKHQDRMRRRVEEGKDGSGKKEDEGKAKIDRRNSSPVKGNKSPRLSMGSPSKGKKETAKNGEEEVERTRRRMSVEREGEEGRSTRRDGGARSASPVKSPQRKKSEGMDTKKTSNGVTTPVKGRRGRPVGWRKEFKGGYLHFNSIQRSPTSKAQLVKKKVEKLAVKKIKKKYSSPAKKEVKKGVVRKKIAKASPMKTRALQKRSEKEENLLLPRCVLCKKTNGDLFPCAECNALYHIRKCCRYAAETVANIQNGLRNRWLCARCTSCFHCSEFITDPQNVECIVCALAYHGKCADKGGKMLEDNKFACLNCVQHLNEVKSKEEKGKEEKKEETNEKSDKNRKRARSIKGWAFVGQEKDGVEEKRRIDKRDELYDNLMELVTRGTNSGNPNSPSKFGAISSSPQKLKKVALQADIDLYESAKAALAAERKTKNMNATRNLQLSSLPSTSSAAVDDPDSFQWIYVGSRKDKMKSVYSSPYPPHIVASSTVFICPFCLRANADEEMFRIHQLECTWSCPPGNEIYRDTEKKLSFFEIDGDIQKLYCRRVCLLGKLFISSKTLVDEVGTFLFYVLTEHTNDGCEFVGYFSKEKNPSKNNNLSCILTLPSAMRSGYGRLLIDLSYELSRIEKKIGSPEHPLSDLGIIAYRGFWRSSILCYLRSLRGTNVSSVKEMSLATRIAPHDIINQLMRDGLLYYRDGYYYINTEQRAYRMPLANTRRKTIDHSKLKWMPNDESQDNLDSNRLNYYV